MSITFARFNSHAAARAASALIPLDSALSRRPTGAHSGAMVVGAVVGLLAAAAIAAFMLLGMPWGSIPAPGATMAVGVGFSTLLGCLGGALCFATNTNAPVQLLREWLREDT
jgi:hypothetical protein